MLNIYINNTSKFRLIYDICWFSKCRADILNAVDNYAVLCTDVVWCYLCLKNIDDLPDAGKVFKMIFFNMAQKFI